MTQPLLNVHRKAQAPTQLFPEYNSVRPVEHTLAHSPASFSSYSANNPAVIVTVRLLTGRAGVTGRRVGIVDRAGNPGITHIQDSQARDTDNQRPARTRGSHRHSRRTPLPSRHQCGHGTAFPRGTDPAHKLDTAVTNDRSKENSEHLTSGDRHGLGDDDAVCTPDGHNNVYIGVLTVRVEAAEVSGSGSGGTFATTHAPLPPRRSMAGQIQHSEVGKRRLSIFRAAHAPVKKVHA